MFVALVNVLLGVHVVLFWMRGGHAFVLPSSHTNRHVPHRQTRSTVICFESDSSLSTVREECDATDYAEGSMTSTYCEGTPETDIVLSWEPDMADTVRKLLLEKQTDGPLLIGVVGNPGSGKTTSCTILADLLKDVGSMVMPFDGYHIPTNILAQQPNADDLLYRRGAPDTFDAEYLLRDLNVIKHQTSIDVVSIPGFDHSVGDPIPNQHTFQRNQHNVVVVEGLYLLHDSPEWHRIRNLLDWKVFVNADVDVCVERLKWRNQCIPGYTVQEIEQRCEVVDRANANLVELSKHFADTIVDSAAQRTITTTISDGTPESEIVPSWEQEVATLIREQLKQEPDSHNDPPRPYMVSLVGGPGCGKTTSCSVLSELLDDLGVFVVPFDGYHYPTNVLQMHPDAAELIYRRGAPDTFDQHRLYRDLTRIRCGREGTIGVPGFDHAVGDPSENEHVFDRSKHRVVVCEGLYLLYDDETWSPTKSLFDYNIFVKSDVDSCIERLKIRNKCIPGYTEEEIEERCERVDRVNALLVDSSQYRADRVVESVTVALEEAESVA